MFHSLIFSINHSNNVRGAGAHRIAQVLRNEGWDCEVIDFVLYWPKEILQEFVKSRITADTKLIGFSCFANSWNTDMDDFAKWIKDNWPHITTVMGSQEVLKTNIDKKNIDWYVDSFGDKAAIELSKYLVGNGKRPVTDLNEQARSGRKVIRANINYPAFPMASLSVDYEARDFVFEYEMMVIEIGRGCKFKCDFCNFPVLGVKGDYTRDAADFDLDLRRNYDRWGIKNYFVAEETFNDSTEKIIKFADVVEKLPFEPWFGGFVRGDLIVSRPQDWEHLARMRHLGHHYGIESTNWESAKSIGKGMRPEKQLDGLLKAREYFKTQAPYRGTMSFIAGLQHETMDTLKKTNKWLIDNWMEESVLYYGLQIPSDDTTENMSDLSRDWSKKGYSIIDYERHIPPEYGRYTLAAEMPPMRWKTEHMDIYDAFIHVGEWYEQLNPKFREIFWNFGNIHRDYRLPIKDILKFKSYHTYSEEADNNRQQFLKDYIDNKLNYRSKN
jgi:hypothetical protein